MPKPDQDHLVWSSGDMSLCKFEGLWNHCLPSCLRPLVGVATSRSGMLLVSKSGTEARMQSLLCDMCCGFGIM